MKTQKNFRKRALLSSVAMLLVATVAVGSATFAWFSQNTSANAQGITAKTSQSSNIVLSETGTSGWTDNLTFAGSNAVITTPLNPATTNSFPSFYTTKAVGKDTGIMGTGQSLTTATAGVDYLTTELYVKYEATEGSVNVNLDLTTALTTGTEDFIRVALVPKLDNTLTNTIVYGNDQDDFAKNPGKFTSLTAINTDDEGKTLSLVTHTNTRLMSGVTLNAGTSYGYDVYVWYEGTDPDCIDSNSVNEIPISFSFSKA